jgi:hypothetical protein
VKMDDPILTRHTTMCPFAGVRYQGAIALNNSLL